MVLLDGQPVNSCSYLAVQAEGRAITTVEGVMVGDDMHPLQRRCSRRVAFSAGSAPPA